MGSARRVVYADALARVQHEEVAPFGEGRRLDAVSGGRLGSEFAHLGGQ